MIIITRLPSNQTSHPSYHYLQTVLDSFSFVLSDDFLPCSSCLWTVEWSLSRLGQVKTIRSLHHNSDSTD